MTLVIGEDVVVEVVVPPKLIVNLDYPRPPIVKVLYPDVTTIEIQNPDIPNIKVPALPGPRGEKGEQGIPGMNGDGIGSFTFIQALPLDTWIIEHPLPYKPAVTIVDSAGSVVIGDVAYSGQTLTVTFSAGFSGTAYLS